jgi:hypothetical protein
MQQKYTTWVWSNIYGLGWTRAAIVGQLWVYMVRIMKKSSLFTSDSSINIKYLGLKMTCRNKNLSQHAIFGTRVLCKITTQRCQEAGTIGIYTCIYQRNSCHRHILGISQDMSGNWESSHVCVCIFQKVDPLQIYHQILTLKIHDHLQIYATCGD